MRLRYAAALMALFIIAGCIPQKTQPVPRQEAFWLDGLWPHEKSDLPRHETALFGRLDNGLRYIIERNAKPEKRVSIYLDVQTGSLMESDEELGLAHFLEHMAFNGGRHFPPGELIPFFQRNGMAFGRDVNAHTAHQETVYKLNLSNSRKENLDQGMLVLRDVADGLCILPEEVEKERGVILAEKTARDSIQYRASRRMRAVIYNGTRFLNDPIGEEQIIRTASAKTIRAFYDAWYQPENMVLVVVGDVDPAVAETALKGAFSDLKSHGKRRESTPWGDVNLSGVIPYYDRYETELASVRIGSVKPRIWEDDSEDVQRRMAYDAMVSSILSRRLQQIRATGKAPFVNALMQRSDSYNLFPSANLIALCEPDKWQDSLALLQREYMRAEQYGFLPEEVETARAELLRAYKLKAERASNQENDEVAQTIVACLNANRVYQSWQQTYDMYSRFFSQATPENLHEAFMAMWNSGNHLVSVTGNAEIPGDAGAFIRAAWELGQNQQVTPPVPAEKSPFPYADEPKQNGNIASRTTLPVPGTDLSLHEVRFENGLVLRMLPTPFMQGSTSISLHIGNGSDALGDSGYMKATAAVLADRISGFGKLTAEQARRLQNLHGYNADFSLNRESYVISGAGETEDMEGILRAMWTQYKDPAIDAHDRERLLESLAIADAGRLKTLPEALPYHSRLHFFGNSLRNRPATATEAARIPLADMRKALRTLCNGGSPVLNMVGDFTPETAVALAGRFFGSPEVRWPTASLQHGAYIPVFPDANARNMAITVPTRLGQEAIEIAYHRDLDNVTDRKTLAIRRMLAAVVRDRLRTTVREELGASYSPSTRYMAYENDGYGLYLISIGTNNGKLPLLREAVDKTLADIVANGIRQEELDRQKRPMLTALRNARRDNRIYIRLLNLMARRDQPYMQWDAEYPALLESLSADELHGEAKAAFKTENRAEITATEAVISSTVMEADK